MRENTIYLHGQVYGTPIIIINENNEIVKGKFAIRTVRRLKMNDDYGDNNFKYDIQAVSTADTKLINTIKNMKENDIVDVKGVISTRNGKKKSVCTYCHETNKVDSMTTYVTPIFLCIRERNLSEEEGMLLIKERNEISNTAYILATVVNDVNYYESKAVTYAEYPILIGRKYWIKTDPADLKVDFPYVRSFNGLAKKDKKCIKKGSHVFINGSLQTRSFKRHTCCETCGKEYEWDSSVMEIIPYSTEYLEKVLNYEDAEGENIDDADDNINVIADIDTQDLSNFI